ncbi:hypothetical protein Agub_g4441, partial [Astrephomene gubernaculifera]
MSSPTAAIPCPRLGLSTDDKDVAPTAPERLAHHGSYDADAPSEHVGNCLDVIACSFVSQPSTQMYLAHPDALGISFWRTMAWEIVRLLPADTLPLFVLPSALRPEAVALAYPWRPDRAFRMPHTEAMLRPEVAAAWEACGELWHNLMLDTYAKHGEFLNI